MSYLDIPLWLTSVDPQFCDDCEGLVMQLELQDSPQSSHSTCAGQIRDYRFVVTGSCLWFSTLPCGCAALKTSGVPTFTNSHEARLLDNIRGGSGDSQGKKHLQKKIATDNSARTDAEELHVYDMISSLWMHNMRERQPLKASRP